MTQETGITFDEAQEIRENCKRTIALADALTRLHDNPDFKMVFIDHYMEKEPARLVHLLGDASVNMGDKKEAIREDVHERMIGIARFAEFIRGTYAMASMAENTLQDLNTEIAQYDAIV